MVVMNLPDPNWVLYLDFSGGRDQRAAFMHYLAYRYHYDSPATTALPPK